MCSTADESMTVCTTSDENRAMYPGTDENKAAYRPNALLQHPFGQHLRLVSCGKCIVSLELVLLTCHDRTFL